MTISMGKRIAEHRKTHGMTQDQLAERLGVTKQAVSKWENEQCYPDITIIPELAEIFQCSIDSLFGVTASDHSEPDAHSSGEDRVTWCFSIQTPDKSDPGGCSDSETHSWNTAGLGITIWLLLMGLAGFAGLVAGHLGIGTSCNYWDYGWVSAMLAWSAIGLKQKKLLQAVCILCSCFLWVQSIIRLPFHINPDMLFPSGLILLALCLLPAVLRRK